MGAIRLGYHQELEVYHQQLGVHHQEFEVYHRQLRLDHQEFEVYHQTRGRTIKNFGVYHPTFVAVQGLVLQIPESSHSGHEPICSTITIMRLSRYTGVLAIDVGPTDPLFLLLSELPDCPNFFAGGHSMLSYAFQV